MSRFYLRDVIWCILLVAVALGWYIDRERTKAHLPPPIVLELRALGNKVRYFGRNGAVDIWRDSQVVQLEFIEVTDLTPLSESNRELYNLDRIDMEEVKTTDLSPLTRIQSLRHLNVYDKFKPDTATLVKLSRLKELYVDQLVEAECRQLKTALPNCDVTSRFFTNHSFENIADSLK